MELLECNGNITKPQTPYNVEGVRKTRILAPPAHTYHRLQNGGPYQPQFTVPFASPPARMVGGGDQDNSIIHLHGTTFDCIPLVPILFKNALWQASFWSGTCLSCQRAIYPNIIFEARPTETYRIYLAGTTPGPTNLIWGWSLCTSGALFGRRMNIRTDASQSTYILIYWSFF